MISVVIPTCCRPDLLARCLERLAPGVQTLPPEHYEVIVTDDGTPGVERLVAQRFPWARWEAGPQRGPAANRNAGVRHGRGEWVAFTDDDCVSDPGWLAGFAAAPHEGCHIYEGKTTCTAGVRSPLEGAPINTAGGFLWSCNMLIRRTTFEALGGFDEAFPHSHLEDVDFRERLAGAALRFEFVPAAVVDHPPRRLRSGWALALSHESDVYYRYKHGRGGLATPRVLHDVLRTRLSRLVNHPLSGDTGRALGSMAVELAALVFLLPGWERKYRRRLLGNPL
jgi:GT2 family glycosyltransferase